MMQRCKSLCRRCCSRTIADLLPSLSRTSVSTGPSQVHCHPSHLSFLSSLPLATPSPTPHVTVDSISKTAPADPSVRQLAGVMQSGATSIEDLGSGWRGDRCDASRGIWRGLGLSQAGNGVASCGAAVASAGAAGSVRGENWCRGYMTGSMASHVVEEGEEEERRGRPRVAFERDRVRQRGGEAGSRASVSGSSPRAAERTVWKRRTNQRQVAASSVQQQSEVVLPASGRISVRQLAVSMGIKLRAVTSAVASLGLPLESGSGSQAADALLSCESAELLCLEFNRSVRKAGGRSGAVTSEAAAAAAAAAEGSKEWASRAPVVAVMGHVDHGKTSLLDALRSTAVAEREAGGITQHIGAFVVSMASGAQLTFLDTPGHAAFTAMRRRGAEVTDIVVLVVAADDGVMPQTLESIAHAQEAGVPMVIALTKCDKAAADPARAKQQLIEHGLELEEIGGDVQVVEVSALNKTGLDQLEEALLLQAELMDLRGREEGPVEAVVVEARMQRGQGPVATVMVKGGEMRPGCCVVAGRHWGRVRNVRDCRGRAVSRAGPSMPVEIDGLKGVPEAGERLVEVATEEAARKLVEQREVVERQAMATTLPPSPSANAAAAADDGDGEEGEAGSEEERKSVEVVVVVKGDVQGSVEAVSSAVEALHCPMVTVRVVYAGVGPIVQSDIDIAEATSAAAILGFNVKPMSAAIEAAARRAKVEMRLHRVIYHLLEDFGQLVVALAPGVKQTVVSGEAEVLQTFQVRSKAVAGGQLIAGCRVTDGKLIRGGRVVVKRSGDVVHEGVCASLRREKAEVESVNGRGVECGLTMHKWGEFVAGDVVEFVEEVVQKPRLVTSQDGIRIEF